MSKRNFRFRNSIGIPTSFLILCFIVHNAGLPSIASDVCASVKFIELLREHFYLRRRLGLELYDIMSTLMFETSDTERTLFDALLDARRAARAAADAAIAAGAPAPMASAAPPVGT